MKIKKSNEKNLFSAEKVSYKATIELLSKWQNLRLASSKFDPVIVNTNFKFYVFSLKFMKFIN